MTVEQTNQEDLDVVILGGGMAGLTLSLELDRARPGLRQAVIERQSHPVPEAAHKVGESTVELGAHYLRDVLGLDDHLQTQQLRKFGLRIFFSADDNSDIARRVEYGQIEDAPLPAYQIDRGRLENALASTLEDLGTLRDGWKVQEVVLKSGDDPHLVTVTDDRGGTHLLRSRWVVDATGRRALLKKKLGLAKKVGHHANAAWFRVGAQIEVDDWTNDQRWQDRVRCGRRSLSTNHLMGAGYWVWIIPLSSGSTSIGIVSDASAHRFDEMANLEGALAWLRRREPQCAVAVEEHIDKIQDFRVMRDYSYSCRQVFSTDRWCLTGEAAVAIDPLYSPGTDLIAVGNGLITDLVTRDLGGEPVAELIELHDQIFLILAQVWLLAYEGQYGLMGNAQVMVAKVIWDTVIYWAFPGLLYFQGTLRDLQRRPTVVANLYRCWGLHERVQRFFREWHAIDEPVAVDNFADPYSLLSFLRELHLGMAADLTDDELDAQFALNTRLLEQMFGQLVAVVVDRAGKRSDEETRKQIESWRADPMISEVLAVYQADRERNPIDDRWVTLGHEQVVAGEAV